MNLLKSSSVYTFVTFEMKFSTETIARPSPFHHFFKLELIRDFLIIRFSSLRTLNSMKGLMITFFVLLSFTIRFHRSQSTSTQIFQKLALLLYIYTFFYRKINVTGFFKPSGSVHESECWKPVVSQKYYILFAEIRDGGLTAYNDDHSGAVVDWTEENEAKVWRGLGKYT